MNPTLSVAIQALADLSRFLLRSLDALEHQASASLNHKHYFTHLHSAAERLLADKLRKAARLSQFSWQLDLIDPRYLFLHRHPDCFLSLVLYKHNKAHTCLVYNILTQEVYSAISGLGAYANTRRIRVSKKNTGRNQAELCVIAFDRAAFMRYNAQNIFKHWLVTGSSMLDIVRLASGCIDGVVTLHLNPIQLQIAQLLLQEAGALTESLQPVQQNVDRGASGTAEHGENPVSLIAAHQQVITHLKRHLCLT